MEITFPMIPINFLWQQSQDASNIIYIYTSVCTVLSLNGLPPSLLFSLQKPVYTDWTMTGRGQQNRLPEVRGIQIPKLGWQVLPMTCPTDILIFWKYFNSVYIMWADNSWFWACNVSTQPAQRASALEDLYIYRS